MKHADRVVVEDTVQEHVKSGSRPYVLKLDGNVIGDFDAGADAHVIRLEVIRSLEEGWPFAVLRARFEKLSVLHAKLSGEYQAMAKECGIADATAAGVG